MARKKRRKLKVKVGTPRIGNVDIGKPSIGYKYDVKVGKPKMAKKKETAKEWAARMRADIAKRDAAADAKSWGKDIKQAPDTRTSKAEQAKLAKEWAARQKASKKEDMSAEEKKRALAVIKRSAAKAARTPKYSKIDTKKIKAYDK